MSEQVMDFSYCDELVKDFEKVIEQPIVGKLKTYYTGVDLGTACVVLAVLDEKRRPVAGAYRYADVVKEGLLMRSLSLPQIFAPSKTLPGGTWHYETRPQRRRPSRTNPTACRGTPQPA